MTEVQATQERFHEDIWLTEVPCHTQGCLHDVGWTNDVPAPATQDCFRVKCPKGLEKMNPY
jgi:hypothetical protein